MDAAKPTDDSNIPLRRAAVVVQRPQARSCCDVADQENAGKDRGIPSVSHHRDSRQTARYGTGKRRCRLDRPVHRAARIFSDDSAWCHSIPHHTHMPSGHVCETISINRGFKMGRTQRSDRLSPQRYRAEDLGNAWRARRCCGVVHPITSTSPPHSSAPHSSANTRVPGLKWGTAFRYTAPRFSVRGVWPASRTNTPTRLDSTVPGPHANPSGPA